MEHTLPGEKLMGCEWVCVIMRNGVCGSGHVSLGYTQIPGVDYQDNFFNMVHDMTLRIGMVNWVVKDLDAEQMDVKTAFLE